MPPVQVLLIAAAAGCLWIGTAKVVHGVKAGVAKAKHAIVHVIAHQK